MKTVLVTGFEPFGGDARNPSGELAQALDGRTIAGHRVVGAVLPCAFAGADRELTALLRRHCPAAVIALGLAGTRSEITPERVAINVDDARIADNAGKQPLDRPIVRSGPTGYWSTLPVKAIVADLQRREISASVSQTAGTFVCNHTFYQLMHALRRRRTVRGGFIHVPWPADWDQPTASRISFAKMVEAIEAALVMTLRRRTDARRRGGAEQ